MAIKSDDKSESPRPKLVLLAVETCEVRSTGLFRKIGSFSVATASLANSSSLRIPESIDLKGVVAVCGELALSSLWAAELG